MAARISGVQVNGGIAQFEAWPMNCHGCSTASMSHITNHYVAAGLLTSQLRR
jgi:hypothetical protein